MTPYYQHDGITIYCGDCREILPTLPKVDVVMSDPPYGVGMKAFDDVLATGIEGFNSAPGKIGVMFMSPAKIAEVLAGCPSWRFNRCLWMHKAADIAFPWRGWCMNSEAILVFSRDGAEWPKYDGARSDVYQVGPWERAGHPNGKPLEVLYDILRHVSTEASTILDPFAGSGTTLVAAKRLGRQCIGIEIEEKYCEIAARRVEAERLTLFEAAGIPTTESMFC